MMRPKKGAKLSGDAAKYYCDRECISTAITRKVHLKTGKSWIRQSESIKFQTNLIILKLRAHSLKSRSPCVLLRVCLCPSSALVYPDLQSYSLLTDMMISRSRHTSTMFSLSGLFRLVKRLGSEATKAVDLDLHAASDSWRLFDRCATSSEGFSVDESSTCIWRGCVVTICQSSIYYCTYASRLF